MNSICCEQNNHQECPYEEGCIDNEAIRNEIKFFRNKLRYFISISHLKLHHYPYNCDLPRLYEQWYVL